VWCLVLVTDAGESFARVTATPPRKRMVLDAMRRGTTQIIEVDTTELPLREWVRLEEEEPRGKAVHPAR
jgi:antitoxin (DNA-binding transcriptional repressor) of toxin-antitoxin stability system